MLYICATPIGNLDDITIRVMNTLKEADLIVAEDTRHTLHLLNHLNIKKPLLSFHKFSDENKLNQILEKLETGEEIALVSDAGMPCISDPGYEIVKACIDRDLPMTVLPGASAFTTALILSGLPTENFIFYGFLPQKKSTRTKLLAEIGQEKATLLFYEAPHRIQKTLDELLNAFGDRKIAVARELTKKFEEVKRGTISELIVHFEVEQPRGEFVLVVDGNKVIPEKEELDYVIELNKYLVEGIDKKEAIRLISERAGVSRREVYNFVHQK